MPKAVKLKYLKSNQAIYVKYLYVSQSKKDIYFFLLLKTKCFVFYKYIC